MADVDIPRLAEQAHLAYTQVLAGFGIHVPPWPDTTNTTKEAWCAAVEEVLRRA
jgi:hypothetical protein